MTPQASSCRRWCLVLLAFTEVLTATGIMFGMSAASLAMQREGVYAELCSAPASAANAGGACNAQTLRLNIVYAAGATAIPLAMMVWGPMMDRYGARAIRVTSLTIFITGTLLFGLANHDPSTVLDAYTIAAALVSTGGGGFFLSHFIIAEHFRGTHFGLVHAILNAAFDASTVTMVALEGAHSAGLSLRGCFLCLAGLGGFYMALSADVVWQGLLAPPAASDVIETDAVDANAMADVSAGDAAAGQKGDAASSAAPPPSQYGPAHDLSHLPVTRQLCSTHFMAVALWALVSIFRTMFVLGTIGPQVSMHAPCCRRGFALTSPLLEPTHVGTAPVQWRRARCASC